LKIKSNKKNRKTKRNSLQDKMKRGNKTIRISKLTNLFFGIAIGFGLGYRGGTLNLIISLAFVIITIILALIYKNQK